MRCIERIAVLTATLIVLPLGDAAPAAAAPPAGHVYIETNAPASNAVVVFERTSRGTLAFAEMVPTGGQGIAPTGLGSQASLAITADGEHLLAVNAGSDDVSIFDVGEGGLRLTDVERVGARPVSVAVSGAIVYVLNQGADTIQGLRITDEGTLAKIAHSTRPLSGSGSDAAQVAFNPDGRVLAVTEKATQTIDTYLVRPSGRTIGPIAQPSSGPVPFGFQFGPDGRLYVSEAPESAVSSYNVDDAGALSRISASVPNNQSAACWLVVTSDGRFAYTANAASANVSQYEIGDDGSLALVGDGEAGATGAGPVDLDLTDHDRFLYVLNSRSGSISEFAVVQSDGSLALIDTASGFATGWAGLIAV